MRIAMRHLMRLYSGCRPIPGKSLTAACLHLATEVLGLPEQQEAEKQVEEVKRWLQKRRGWLLILDNVEKPEAVLSAFVPSQTTRGVC